MIEQQHPARRMILGEDPLADDFIPALLQNFRIGRQLTVKLVALGMKLQRVSTLLQWIIGAEDQELRCMHSGQG